MRSLRLLTISSLVAIAVTAGCGGPAPSSGPADDYWNRLLEASCDVGVRCGRYESLESCTTLLSGLRASLGSMIVSEDAAIANGSIAFDGKAADACIDLSKSLSCSSTTDTKGTACDAVFKGTHKTGEACYFSGQCVSDQCNATSCPMACCPGTCATPPTQAAIGQSCATTACVDGAFCDSSQTCRAQLAVGAACTGILDCERSLYCGDSSHTCLAPAAVGEACNPAEASYPFFACRFGKCDAATKKCVAPVFAGAACDPKNDLCGFGLSCDPATSKCSDGLPLGQPCSTNSGWRCAPGGFCKWNPNPGTGVCSPLESNGQPCNDDASCDSGTCDQTTGTCADPRACA